MEKRGDEPQSSFWPGGVSTSLDWGSREKRMKACWKVYNLWDERLFEPVRLLSLLRSLRGGVCVWKMEKFRGWKTKNE